MSPETIGNTRTLGGRIAALRDRHRRLDESISEEQNRPLPDLATLQKLKRARLRTKDEIALREGLLRTIERPDRHVV